MPSILHTNYYSQPLLSVLNKVLPSGFNLISINEASKEEIIKKASGADYFLVGGRIKIDREIIDAAPKLKMIQRTGVGLDSLDLKVLKEKKIPVYVNQGVNARSVAEHTLMLILAVLRRVNIVDSIIKKGTWIKHELGIQNNDLYGKTVGLIGLGSIGLQVARLLKHFGVDVLYTKRTKLSINEESDLDVSYSTLLDLLKESDIISLHCPLYSETKGLIGPKEFSLMKKGAILINTSRGKLIDEYALIKNLKNGYLKGAGLDVFEQEPLPRENELLKLKNVILTPHISGITLESFEKMMSEALGNIKLFEEGKSNLISHKKINNG